MIWKLHVITRNRINPSRVLEQLGIVTTFGTSINPTSFFLGVEIDRPTRQAAIQDVVDLLTPVIGRDAIERVEGADELMQNRQLLLWVRATRRQLLRWERLVANSVRASMTGADRHDAEAWDTDTEKHLTLVAANTCCALSRTPTTGSRPFGQIWLVISVTNGTCMSTGTSRCQRSTTLLSRDRSSEVASSS